MRVENKLFHYLCRLPNCDKQGPKNANGSRENDIGLVFIEFKRKKTEKIDMYL